LEASLKGSMVVFAFDYFFVMAVTAKRRESWWVMGDDER
jgi:hypothetical protein